MRHIWQALDRRGFLHEHSCQSPYFAGWMLPHRHDAMKYCPSCRKTYPVDYNVCPADQTRLEASHEFQPGMVIRNKYEILGRIGIGGMGAVYRGRHVTFNELCAIKIVNDSIAGDTNFLQRFQTEAVITRKLRHPNAVRVDDFDYTEEGRPFIVMELVEGRNVGEVLQAEGPFPVPRALRIARQTALALGAAHKLGFVHRDIKPANIILATDEQREEIAKVLDFGIAKLRQAAGHAQSGMTMTGMVVGTPLYMSPEQFMGKKAGEEIDGRTDLYSLGVVLYQMVTARSPFDGDTIYAVMMRHMEGKVCPPHELTPELGIPSSLSQVILKAVAKSRDERYQTADDLIAALDQVAGELPASENIAAPAVGASNVAASPIAPTQASRASEVSSAPRTEKPAPPPSIAVPPAETPASSASVTSSPVTTSPATPTPAPPAPAAPIPSAVPLAEKPAAPRPLPNSQMVKSAAQHLFLQHRTFRARNLVMLALLGLVAIVVVGGLGYVKYRAVERLRIEKAVVQGFQSAPSPTLRTAHLSVTVDDAGEVTLDGSVENNDDLNAATALAAAVRGVKRVDNRLQVVPALPAAPGPTQPESSASLVNRGMALMDEGKYAEAIDCFTKAANDPNNQSAKQLLETARRAQKTEELLLRKRQ
jgi:serine/threonine protein kinase